MDDILEKLSSLTNVAILLAFLILWFLVGRIIQRRKKAGKPTTAPKLMRYFVLPVLLVHLTVSRVFSVPSEHLAIKVTETILSVAVLSFLFHAINYLFFSEHNILTRKEAIPKLGRDVLNFLLTVVFGSVVLSSVWGFDLANLLTALGVGSLVVGLALQDPLGNLFNGISMLMAQPFHKRDWIEIGGEKGKVVDFTWRAVKILNRNNELVIIPNNMIGRSQIKNLSRPSTIHAEQISIGFSYDDHPEDVKRALLTLALETKGVLDDPQPQPLTLAYDDFYINYGLKFYIRDFEDEIVLKDRLMTRLFTMAEENGFTIPFPVRDIRMSGPASPAIRKE